MAANTPAPRPRLKVLPVKVLDPELPTRLLLRIDEKPQFPRLPLGVRINTKAEPLSKEAQGGLGKVRLASVHRFRSCSAEGYDSDAPFAVLGPMTASGTKQPLSPHSKAPLHCTHLVLLQGRSHEAS